MFDDVICTYSLEHFVNPKKVIEEMVRVCKVGGKIIIMSPAWDNIFSYPPSLKTKMKSRFYRIKYIIKRYLNYFFNEPTMIKLNNLDMSTYESDIDTTFIITIGGVKKIFQSNNLEIIYLKTEKKWYNKLFARYWNMPLFIVGKKV